MLLLRLPSGLPYGGSELGFVLTVTAEDSTQGQKSFTLHVASKSDPISYVSFDGYLGNQETSDSKLLASAAENDGLTIILYEDFYKSSQYIFHLYQNMGITEGNYNYVQTIPSYDGPMFRIHHLSPELHELCVISNSSIEISDFKYYNEDNYRFLATFTHDCNNDGSVTTGVLSINQPNSAVPVADAGKGVTVVSGSLVILDGSASFDRNNSSLSYHWSTSTGIEILASESTTTTIVAPAMTCDCEAQHYEFELKVTNAEGYIGKSFVNVTVTEEVFSNSSSSSSNASNGSREAVAGSIGRLFILLCLLLVIPTQRGKMRHPTNQVSWVPIRLW
jgi:hypothetical protein